MSPPTRSQSTFTYDIGAPILRKASQTSEMLHHIQALIDCYLWHQHPPFLSPLFVFSCQCSKIPRLFRKYIISCPYPPSPPILSPLMHPLNLTPKNLLTSPQVSLIVKTSVLDSPLYSASSLNPSSPFPLFSAFYLASSPLLASPWKKWRGHRESITGAGEHVVVRGYCPFMERTLLAFPAHHADDRLRVRIPGRARSPGGLDRARQVSPEAMKERFDGSCKRRWNCSFISKSGAGNCSVPQQQAIQLLKPGGVGPPGESWLPH
eukprot:442256-Hanusia_phi.AAC.2